MELSGMRRIKGRVGLISGLDDLETRKNLLPLLGYETRIVQVAVHYTCFPVQNVELVDVKPVVHIVTIGL